MSEHWKDLEAAFHKALDLEEDARARFLNQLKQDSPDLHTQLRALLRADADGHQHLSQHVAASIETLDNASNNHWIGKTIGHWQIEQNIGAGGMGAVFRARRSNAEFDQTAAIKIMASPLLGPEATMRFRVERQILASLNHRHIARLIDGGETDEGLPYLVMEICRRPAYRQILRQDPTLCARAAEARPTNLPCC